MGRRCIVLAERSPWLLAEIRSLLVGEADAVVMAADEPSMMEAIEKVIPELVITDLSFTVSGETNFLKLIKQHNPSIKIIILSMHQDPSVIEEVINDGADGFVFKQRAVVDLVPAVREVCRGGRYVSLNGFGR